jgi:chaperonin GroEL
MKIKKVIKGDEARQSMYNGLSSVADIVAATAGPNGRNIAIQQEWGTTKLTKDGYNVAKSLTLTDAEGEGAKLLVSASEKTNKQAGDGTTNTCIIAKAIAEEGMKSISKGRRSTDIKRGIDYEVGRLVEKLKEYTKPIETNNEVKQIATISANGDEEIGDMIANAVEKIGRDGVITVEEAKGLNTELEVVEGLQFDQGYLSPYFMTNPEKQIAEFDNPLLFLYDGKINTIQSIVPLLEGVAKSGRSIVIICDEIDNEPLSLLVINKMNGGLKCCAVKAPSFGDYRKKYMEDIATITGGQFISTDFGKDVKDITADMLGSCDKIKISPTETTIIGGHGDKNKVEERVEHLKAELENTESSYDIEKIREQIARLSNGVAIIKVGGATEVEVKEKKDRVEDACCAVRAALEEGVLPGGGVSLIKIAHNLESKKDDETDDFNSGIDIVNNAVKSQLLAIVNNAGKSGEVVYEKILENPDFNYGYDARKNKYCNLVEAGILDATKVVRCALENGSSVAGALLTVEGLVIDDVEANNKLNQPARTQSQMGM